MRELQAVTFDFWDTLVVARMTRMRELRTDALLALIEGAGFTPGRAAVETAIADAFAAYKRAWRANEQFGAPEAIDYILAELGVEVLASVRDELVDALTSGDPDCGLTPNVAATLSTLKNAGLRLGIICDVGWSPSTRLRCHLERHGVLTLFDHWSFSDDVGHYKPAPQIFRHAHDGLGVADPARAAHIGDLRRTDIAGARGCGALAVRYAGAFDDRSDAPEGHRVITDHAELPAALGLT